MKRIINLYITREISSLFLLGIAVFTLVLLMGRLIKLTDLVISRGVALADVALMIVYLMPSFLVFTIPMAFLLAVLLAFGRLSGDNEITVLKACGISLAQLMPPVLCCSAVAVLLTLAASVIGVPWGNSAFKSLSVRVLKENAAVTIREKVFWDEIPGVVLYSDRYDEERQALKGVIIHDGRDPRRPLTIFAGDGRVGGLPSGGGLRLVLNNGSIHSAGREGEYRMVTFGEYVMSVAGLGGGGGISRSETDLSLGELASQAENRAIPRAGRLKASAEFHSRLAFPLASVVFAILAVPLGIQNRRSGKSAGFSASIAILLLYYITLSLLRTLAERGTLPPGLALWLPNLIFAAVGGYLFRLASREEPLPTPSLAAVRALASRWTSA